MNRNLGQQFSHLKQRTSLAANEAIARAVAPLQRSIIAKGEANQPEIDLALANMDKTLRSLGR